MEYDVKTGGWDRALDLVKLLSLPDNLKRRYVARIGRLVIKQTKENVKHQKTVDGSPMKPRQSEGQREKTVFHRSGPPTTKKGKSKMFVDMVKGKFLGVKLPDASSAKVIFFRNAGNVAYRHHHGGDTWYKLRIKAKFPESDKYKKCNPSQALELVKVGYIKNGKRLTKSEIMQTVTVGEAAHIVNSRKDQWKISSPARPVLGATDEQVVAFGDAIQGSLTERFRAKQYEHLMV